MRRVELDAHEDLRVDRDALLRQIGRDRMNSHELRREPVRPVESRLRARAHGIDLGRRRASRGGIHHFPRERRAVRRVLADEAVQMRRAGPRQPDDEHGVGYLLALDGRVLRTLLLEAQQILEQAHEELAHGDPAERRETRLVAIRLEQPLERLLDRPRAEVAADPARRSAERSKLSISSEGGSAPSRAQRPTAGVQGGHRAAHAACGKAHR